MIRDTLHDVRARAAESRVSAATVACVLLVVLSVVSGVVAAQTGQQTFTDDFEDQNTDGWQSDNPTLDAVNQGAVGDWSLYLDTDAADSQASWEGGPVLDMQDEFVVTGVVRHERTSGTTADHMTRLGISSGQPFTQGENAFLVFNYAEDATYLDSEGGNTSVPAASVSDSFNADWIRFRVWSDADDDTLFGKVWLNGTTEPTDPQLEREFAGISGSFVVNVGENEDTERQLLLDEVTIDGSERTDPDLELDHNNLLLTGEQTDYTVEYTQFDEQLGRNQTTDVTDDANTSVTSMNTTALTVDESNATLQASGNDAIAQRVDVRAGYNGSVTYNYVTVVPEVSMQYLEILPPEYRITAFLGDWTTFLLIIAIGAGIIGTRAATSFLGLSMMELVLIVGWFGGYITRGLLLVSVFACIFIGLNLAANIDYTVRR